MKKNKKSLLNTAKEQEIIDKWLFVFLAANNNDKVRGRIRFIKEFFLIAKEHVPELFEAAEFYAYNFGPYSTNVAYRINELKKEGYIEAKYRSQDWEYSLSSKGMKKAKEILKEIPESIIEAIGKIKEKYKNKTLKSLLKEIYTKYPEYAKRSLIRREITSETVDISDLEKIDDGPGFVASADMDKDIILKGKDAKRFLEILFGS